MRKGEPARGGGSLWNSDCRIEWMLELPIEKLVSFVALHGEKRTPQATY